MHKTVPLLERKNMDQSPHLAISDASHKITKPSRRAKDLRHSASGAQVIKTDVNNFRSLVQQLTGTAKNASMGVLSTPFPSQRFQTPHPSYIEASMHGVAMNTVSPVALQQSPLLPLPHMASPRLQPRGRPQEQTRHVKRQQQLYVQQSEQRHQPRIVQHTRLPAPPLASTPPANGAGHETSPNSQQHQQQRYDLEPLGRDCATTSDQLFDGGSANTAADVLTAIMGSVMHNAMHGQAEQMIGSSTEEQRMVTEEQRATAGDEQAEMRQSSGCHRNVFANMGDGGDGAHGLEAQEVTKAAHERQQGMASPAEHRGPELRISEFEFSTGSFSAAANSGPEVSRRMEAEGGVLTVEDMMTGSEDVMDAGRGEEGEVGSGNVTSRSPSEGLDKQAARKTTVPTMVTSRADECSQGATQVTEFGAKEAGAGRGESEGMPIQPAHGESSGAESREPVSLAVESSHHPRLEEPTVLRHSLEGAQGSKPDRSSDAVAASRLEAAGSEASNQQEQQQQQQQQQQQHEQPKGHEQPHRQGQQQQDQLQGSGAPPHRLSRLRSLAPPPIRASLPPLPPRSQRPMARGRSPLSFTPTPTPPHSASSSNSRSPSPALSPSVHSLAIPMSPHPSATPHSRPSLLSGPPHSPSHSRVPAEGRGILGPSPVPSPRAPFVPLPSLPGTPVRFTPPGSPYFASPLFLSPASSPRGFAWPPVLPDSPASVAMRQAALAMTQPLSPRPPSYYS